MTTMTTEPSEREERLKQIRERQPSREQFLYGQDIDFLLSLLDSQATMSRASVAAVEGDVYQHVHITGGNPCVVGIRFETPEKASEFIKSWPANWIPPAPTMATTECQQCGKVGGKVVSFEYNGIGRSMWVCPHCIDDNDDDDLSVSVDEMVAFITQQERAAASSPAPAEPPPTPEQIVYNVAQRDPRFRKHLIEQLTAMGDEQDTGPLRTLQSLQPTGEQEKL